MRNLLLLVIGLLFICGNALAQPATSVRLPAIFSDHMVVQRDVPVVMWGWADPGGSVTVSMGQTEASTRVGSDGTWRVELPPVPAGGPYEIRVVGSDTLTFKDVLAGEVWIGSGQSNMEWPLASVNNADQEIAAARYPQIRLFTVERAVSPRPEVDVVSEGWKVTSPETVGGFSAVAYFFGRELHQELGVPIGLINSSWGGTVAEAWTSREALRQIPDFHEVLERVEHLADSIDLINQDFDERLAAWTQKVAAEDVGFKDSTPWYQPELDEASWEEMDVPILWESAGLPGFDGVVWYRKTFELTPEQAGGDLTLHLGPIDDIDSTWVNGVPVGSTSIYNRARIYPIEAGILMPGRNTITVRVIDTGGGGGFFGRPDEMALTAGEDASDMVVSLAGPWKYKVALDFTALPPPPVRMSLENTPTTLFNAMIAPLTPYPIQGVIWYQGESNAGRAYQYRKLFPTLIDDWRSQWDNVDMPFLFVQLANFMAVQKEPVEPSEWAELREAQSRTLSLPRTAMAVTIDIGEADDIHPRNKQDVGRRLALAALAKVYGRGVEYSGPVYRLMRREGSTAHIVFDHAEGLHAREGEVKGFAIAGPDRRFVAANARIEGNTVIVSSPEVAEPVAVRYGWANNPVVNLYNAAGLPASPFRTDDWPGVTEGKR